MKNLLRHEFFKLRKNKTIYIAFVITLIASIIWAETVVSFPEATGGAIHGSQSLVIAGELNEILLIICAVVVSSIAVADYQRGVTRNIVMSGHSRTKIYLSKYIVCLLSAIALFTASVVTSAVIASSANGWGNAGLDKFILTYLHMLLQYAAVIAVILFIADLTRSTAAAIGVNIGLIILFSFLGSISIKVVGADGEMVSYGSKFIEFIGDMYVGILSQRASNPDLAVLKIIQYVITALVTWTAAFIGGTYLFNKRDIK